MTLVTSEFIVIASGDDISACDRVEKIVNTYRENGTLAAVCSNAMIIDDSGQDHGLFYHGKMGIIRWEEMARYGTSFAFGAAMSWHRKVFDVFGPLPLNVRNEDQIIPFRSALLGGIKIIPDVLVSYREHEANLSFWSGMKRETLDGWLKLRAKQITNIIGNYEEWLNCIDIYRDNLTLEIMLRAKEALGQHILILNKEKGLLEDKFFARVGGVFLVLPQLHPKRVILFLLLLISPKIYAYVMKRKQYIIKYNPLK